MEYLDKLQIDAKNSFKQNSANLIKYDKAEILEKLLNEQEEVICSPFRFNGVHIDKIKQVLKEFGIETENKF